ncbi:MAG TPA: hypothetical protein C5S51_08160 [Methanosarcinaceae archaeon]|nr:hypothetical protein [Methanosarcinaceae archaeon]
MEEVFKMEMFERYLKNGELSDDDWEFCERVDWHPVGELPLRDEVIERLNWAKEGKFIKLSSIGDLS